MIYKLGEIADVKGGKRLPKGENLIETPNNHPYIRIRDLTGKRVLQLDDSFLYVDDKIQKTISKYIVNTDDLIISVVGTVGLVAKIGSTLNYANLTENCNKLVNLKEEIVNRDYLYYYLISDVGKAEIKKGIVGAVQPKLPLKNIENFDINLPEMKTQCSIATILSIIDDKIELNNRINDNLQQQSTALFDKFYNGLNSSLISFKECKAFGNLLMGQSPKGESYNIEKIGTPLLNGAADYTNYNLTPLKYTTSPTRVCEQNDLVFCIRATIGLLVFADKQYCLGRGVAAISKTDEQYVEYVYHILNNSIEQLKHQANGSVIVGINKDDILNIKVKIPSNSEIKKFHIMQKPIFEAIKNNRDEILRLTRIRDALLPKLMSGELDVSSIELDI